MHTERNELKAGAFIVITLLLAVVVMVRIRGYGVGATQTREIAFKLTDDLGGLQVGDDLRLGGYKVGTVRDIHGVELGTPNARLLVTVTLPAEYTLHTDAVVAVQSGLTGATNLNIENVGSGKPLADKQWVAGKPDPKSALLASLGRMGPQLESTVQTVQSTAGSANDLLKHANAKVDPVVEQYTKVTGSVNGLLADNREPVRSAIANLDATTASLKAKLPGIIDQVNAVVTKVNGDLDHVQSTLADIEKTASNSKDVTGSLRSVILGNKGKLDGMIASVKTTSDNLKEASIEIRHSPWRLLYKPTPGEAANLNLYDSAREFADGANSLSDAATALRDALHDPQADRGQIQKLVNQLDGSFNHFQQVENKLWTTTRN